MARLARGSCSEGVASLEEIVELFETVMAGLQPTCFEKGIIQSTNEGLEMAVNMRDNFTESEMRRWFRS